MKNKWRMPHPASMFLLLTVIVIIVSWICDIYGLSVHSPQTGEDLRVQNLLNADGLRWMLKNIIPNFTGFTPLGMTIMAMFGVGIAQHSGFFDACIRRSHRHHRFEQQQMLIIVILLGILSNVMGDAGYVILLPIAATMFRSVALSPTAGIITAYVSVACGYSANFFVTIIDPMLSINTERAAFSSGKWEMGVGPMCNYYFFFISTIVIGAVIYFVASRYLLRKSEVVLDDSNYYKPLSNKERRAFNLALIIGLLYLSVVLIGAYSSFGVLRGVDGGLIYSPFTMNMLTILSLGIAIAGGVYGFSSGRYRNDKDIINALVSSMQLLSLYLVIAFFASQLYACFSYSHLDKYLALNFASLLTSISSGPLITLLIFIIFTAFINMIFTSATGKWTFMSLIFVPYFAQRGISPDIVQCAFRIGDSATNAITPFLFYMPLVLTFMQQYDKETTYATLLKGTWRFTLYILIAWILLFTIWYTIGLPFGR